MNSISVPPSRFNVRVYGIYIKAGAILLSDECRFGKKMTKFPGGGLEYGEGIEEALKREWIEELETEIEVEEIMYVNPFLQISAFNPKDQVICLYYKVRLKNTLQIPISSKAFDFEINGEDQQSFRWKKLDELLETDLTFPIDQSLVPVLRSL